MNVIHRRSLARRAARAALTAVLCARILAPGAGAQTTPTTRDALLVPTSWLSRHLRDPDLVLLHVGDKAEYDARHIPGARFVSLDLISVSDRSNTPGSGWPRRCSTGGC